MRLSVIPIVLLIMSNICFGIDIDLADHWFCTQEASKMVGTAFYSCGVGPDSESATEAALREFKRFCSPGTDCFDNRRKWKAEPGRLTCEKMTTYSDMRTKKVVSEQIICYRLIIYHYDY